jgi:hypothetical protein
MHHTCLISFNFRRDYWYKFLEFITPYANRVDFFAKYNSLKDVRYIDDKKIDKVNKQLPEKYSTFKAILDDNNVLNKY